MRFGGKKESDAKPKVEKVEGGEGGEGGVAEKKKTKPGFFKSLTVVDLMCTSQRWTLCAPRSGGPYMHLTVVDLMRARVGCTGHKGSKKPEEEEGDAKGSAKGDAKKGKKKAAVKKEVHHPCVGLGTDIKPLSSQFSRQLFMDTVELAIKP
eukprot:7119828-Pyramimonas_sp.AAC.1